MSFFALHRGTISGLLRAVFFSIGATIYRSASVDIEAEVMNLFRSILGFLFFFSLALLFNDLSSILALNKTTILFLVLSVVLNVVLGDTVYFLAQKYIGVSRALSITNLKPLFTLFLAAFFLGEPLTTHIFTGVILVVAGIYFVTHSLRIETTVLTEKENRHLGLILALFTALCWTGGTLTLRIAFLSDISTISANSVRYAFAILFLWSMSSWKGAVSIQKIGAYNRQTIHMVFIATIFGAMLSTLFWADAIKYAGASKTATLSATSPLFAMFIAVLFLREPFSWKNLLGTILTVIGVGLVV